MPTSPSRPLAPRRQNRCPGSAWKRFVFEALCVLLVLQGPPLLALELAAPPVERRAITVLAESAGDWVAQPWLEAVAVLLALGSSEDARWDSVPPLPPDFHPGQSRPGQLPPGYGSAPVPKDASSVPLGPGWNLISLPAEPSDPDPAAVFAPIAASIERVYAYDACDPADPWKLFDPADPAASDLVTIDHRMGLWVESRSNASLPIEGTPPASTDFSLCSGWNLIGYPSANPRPVPSALAQLLGNLVRVFGFNLFDALVPWEVFDVAAPAWANDLVAMVPGRGYWVLVSTAADFDLVNEGAPPEIALATPGDLDTVTTFTDVVGTVRTPLLQEWTLKIRPDGESGGTLVASASSPVENGTLGVLDPTLLQNGLYELELRAVDILGQTATLTRQVVIDGGLKLGVFELPFLDLEVPLLGVPIQIFRTYDSRDKRQGDFGVGWRLSTSDVSLFENDVQGKGWAGIRQPGLIPNFCILPTRAHIVFITFPDGGVSRFQAVIEPECQQVAPPQVVTVRYLPLAGTLGTLEPLDHDGEVFVAGSFPGEVDLLDFDTVAAYDPSRYRLTTEDGRQLVIDQTGGLESITDLQGHTVRFGRNRIEHSSGLDVELQRDGEGRIEAIVDPAGNAMTYAYDALGDLVAVTDPQGNTTRFTYLENHYLNTLILPDGTEHVAAEYDGDGRWIRSCDSDGRCNSVDHDLSGQREVHTDANGRQRSWSYDTRGNVTALVDGLGHTTQFRYDAQDNLIEIEDPLGHVTRRTFNRRGQVTSITAPHAPGEDPADFTRTVEYNNRGRVTRVREPSGAEIQIGYDSRNRLTALRDGDGTAILERTFDAQGHQLSETTPAGTTTFGDFDISGEPRQVTLASGDTLSANFDTLGNLTELVTSEGTSTLSYDRLGRKLRADHGDGIVVEYEYGFRDAWVRQRDSDGVTERHFDPRGQLTGWSRDDGFSQTFTRDATGLVTAQTDPEGRTQRFEYDAAGRVQKVTAPNGGETEYTYDAAGRLIETVDALGHRSQSTYTPDGRLASSTNALGHTWSVTHTPTENSITDPLGQTTTTRFTLKGNDAEVVFPDGSSELTEYLFDSPLLDGGNLPTRLVDRGGHERSFTYDDHQRLVGASDRSGTSFLFDYDPESGELATVTGPNGPIVQYTYDSAGRIASLDRGDGASSVFSYDASGLETTVTAPSGASTTTVEDGLGNIARVAASNGEATVFQHNSQGELSGFADSLGNHELEVDSLGNLTRFTDAAGANLSYQRDLLGRLVELRVEPTPGASALVTRYTYDAVGNVVAIEDANGGVTSLTYDALNRLTERQLPNGVTTTTTYDAVDQITEIVHRAGGGTVLASVHYERGGLGEPTRITREDGTYRTLGYDAALRLVRETFFDASDQQLDELTYTYDAAGNRLSRGDDAGVATSTYLSGDRLSSVAHPGDPTRDAHFGWDVDGRVAEVERDGETRRYLHDPWDRLRRVERLDGSTIAEYDYNGLGHRARVDDLAGSRRHVVGPGVGELSMPHAVVDGSGSVLGSFAYLGHLPLARLTGSETTYYLTDAMGSVLALSDDAGAVSARFDYDGFGELRQAIGEGADLPPALGGDYRFHGSWLENATGLYHLRARDYDPTTGRFWTRDPAAPNLGAPESFHPYGFANGNPYLWSDPTGQFSIFTVNLSISISSDLRANQAVVKAAIKDYLKDKIKEAVTEQLISFLTSFLALNPDSFEPFPMLSAKDQGIDFEEEVFEQVCKIFGTLTGNRLDEYLRHEPTISSQTGRRLEPGRSCYDVRRKVRPTGQPGLRAGNSRPDFLLRSNPGTDASTDALLIGDVKLSVDTAAADWRRGGFNPRQWRSMTLHARNFQFRPHVVLVITFLGGSQASFEALEKLAKTKGHEVGLAVVNFIGGNPKKKKK